MPEIIDVLHIFSSIMKGLIIRQADVRVSARVVTARPVIMPRVSRRGLNFDLNACQYGVYNSVPTISFAFTRQMNHARARKIVEFTFLTTEHVRPRCASWICFAVGERASERASERNRNDRFSVLRRAFRFARDRFNPSKVL